MENPYVIIQNLYTVIGKKTVELDATTNLNKQYQAQIQALKDKVKELNDARSESDSTSD